MSYLLEYLQVELFDLLKITQLEIQAFLIAKLFYYL